MLKRVKGQLTLFPGALKICFVYMYMAISLLFVMATLNRHLNDRMRIEWGSEE